MLQLIEMLRKLTYFLSALSLIFSPLVQASHYVVQPKDFLSEILKQNNLYPVYGLNGSLKKTVLMNPALAKDNGNKIYPGQRINLPGSVVLAQEQNSIQPTEAYSEKNSLTSNEPSVNLGDVSRSAAATFDEDELPISSIYLGANVEYFRFDTQDKTTFGEAQILSDPNLGLDAVWTIHWSKSFEIFLPGSYQRYSVQNPNINISYMNHKGSLVGFGAGVGYWLTDRFQARLSYDFQQELFIHAPIVGQVQFDALMVSEPSLALRYSLFQLGRFQLGLDAEYRMLMNTSNDVYKVDQGKSYLGGVFIREQFRHQRFGGIEAKLNYSIQDQDTDLETQSGKKLSLQFGLDWEL